ncbi:MAG: hypothetical protein PHN49_09640 [Candidatus Omnitrophica bacterium]|nr:hypothetical protein [Candidatus Omnitrophota bacterium]
MFNNLKRMKDWLFVRPLAYLLWILRRREIGSDLGDWLNAELAVDWLFLIVSLSALVAVAIMCGLRCFLIVIVLGTAIFFNKRKHVADIFMIAALIILIGVNPAALKKEFSVWHKLAKDKFEHLKEAKVSRDGISGAFDLPTKTTSEKPTLNIQPDLRNVTGNIIKNGNFQSWLGDGLSGWGRGLYSDQFRATTGAMPFWINFLNANIRASIEKTAKGVALKIVHISKTQDNSVGVMEQYIDATSGIYRLTFWAKAESDFETGGLQFFTTDEWRITDEAKRSVNRGFEIEKSGPFEWQQFSGEIQIDTPGKRTFFVVSAKKGTIWVTDISLVKIRELTV